MNLRGLEVLLASLGGVLLVLGMTGGLTFAALGWALIGLAGTLLVEAALIRHLLPHYGATRHWARVAARLPGVRLLGDGGRSPPRLRGSMGGCSVRIDRVNGGWQTSVSPIHRDEQADVQLSLRWIREEIIDLERPERRTEWRTGDPNFDRLVEVHGVLPEGLLVLDHAVRRRVIGALSEGVQADMDRLEWTGAAFFSPTDAVQQLRGMVALANSLYALTPERLRARARAIIRTDPHPEVRARTLWLYQEHYAFDDADVMMIEGAMGDDDDRVRLAAAGAKVATGTNEPKAEAMLAEAVARGECPDWALEAATARLLEHGRPEVVTPAMKARLQDEGPLPLAIVQWALAQTRAPRPSVLGHRLVRAPKSDALSAIELLGAGGPPLESALILLLEHPDDSVVDRTIDELAFCGSLRSVPALQSICRSFRRPRRLRYAAADAVTAVRSRGPRGPVGQLSLIDPTSPSGRVSVAD